MKTNDIYAEMKDLNLAYLLLAQQMLREDRGTAIFRLGVSEEVADLIGGLTPAQIVKMAGANMLLCRFRFDDQMLLNLLGSHDRDPAMAHLHATIVAAGKPVESLI